MTNMEKDVNFLTDMENDVIGEVMNISMGSAATAMSTILDKKVNITTPRIENLKVDDFEFSYLEPVVGVLIKYVEGIEGSNILLLREEDLKRILRHLLSMEPEDTLEFDEISMSAICEIMNQMMGAAASALATFLGRAINISPPEIMDTSDKEKIRDLFRGNSENLINIRFNLTIEELVDSEFICAMEPALAKEIVKMSYGSVEEEELQAEPAATAVPEPADAAAAGTAQVPPQVQPVPTPPPAPAAPAAAAPMMPDAYAQQPQPGSPNPAAAAYAPQQPYPPQPPYPPQQQPYVQDTYQQPYMQPQQSAYNPYMQQQVVQNPQVQVAPYSYKPLGANSGSYDGNEIDVHENNLDLIMSVPIQITVELGKTRKKIKDIAELTLGNIVELDRQAGDQVDVIANGRLIAKGDVVVVGDNYSVRITEIIKSNQSIIPDTK